MQSYCLQRVINAQLHQMKYLILSLNILVFYTFSAAQDNHDNQDTLIVNVQNIKKAEGKIWIAVYDNPDMFLGDEVVLGESFDIHETGNLQCKLVLPFGHYALSIFHDKNSNDKLDTKIFGIPKEPYCFSQNARKPFRAPRFDEAVFNFYQNNQITNLRLK